MPVVEAIETVGGSVYPSPGVFRYAFVTSPKVTDAVAAAWEPPPTGAAIVTAGFDA